MPHSPERKGSPDARRTEVPPLPFQNDFRKDVLDEDPLRAVRSLRHMLEAAGSTAPFPDMLAWASNEIRKYYDHRDRHPFVADERPLHPRDAAEHAHSDAVHANTARTNMQNLSAVLGAYARRLEQEGRPETRSAAYEFTLGWLADVQTGIETQIDGWYERFMKYMKPERSDEA